MASDKIDWKLPGVLFDGLAVVEIAGIAAGWMDETGSAIAPESPYFMRLMDCVIMSLIADMAATLAW